jgi:fused signal recognition particle receptor
MGLFDKLKKGRKHEPGTDAAEPSAVPASGVKPAGEQPAVPASGVKPVAEPPAVPASGVRSPAEPSIVSAHGAKPAVVPSSAAEPAIMPQEESEQDDMPENRREGKAGFFEKLKSGLLKTRNTITTRIDQMLAGFGKVDEALFDELEEILITSDVGMSTAARIVDDLRMRVKKDRIADADGVRRAIRGEIAGILASEAGTMRLRTKPSVILVIGVNGVGKTTSIGKMAHMLKRDGKKVVVAAADTFRAAAIEQLEIWTNRAGVPLIRHEEGSDPAAVIFDAIAAVKARGSDILIVDTAGRLHTKKNLMEELKKIYRVIARELPDADMETLLVLDATTGQNAVSQAKTFSELGGLTGLILTKLDGTAKGGIIISIMSELNVPVKFIGVGEKIDDLQPFDPETFVEALFGLTEF